MSSVKYEGIEDKNLSIYLEESAKHEWWDEKYKIISDTWGPHFPRNKSLEEYKMDIEPIVQETYIEEFVEKIKLIPVRIATIDLGGMSLKEFNQTSLAKVLNKYEISYFTLELPHYEKQQFLSQLVEIQNKFNELMSNYDSLKDRNTPSAQELSYLIDTYSNEIMQLKHYINQKIRTDALTLKILQVIKNLDSKELTVIHIGEENTFAEIVKQVKEQNIKSNILFVQKSKFLHSLN